MNPEDRLVGENSYWKTRPKFWAWIRGGLRRALWNQHPAKLDLIKKERFKSPIGKNGQEVWACKCTMCEKIVRQDGCQVDHKHPAGSLKSVNDLEPFITKLSFVTVEDLRIVCKWCNSVLSYADRYGYSFEEALAKKGEIQKKKKKKTN